MDYEFHADDLQQPSHAVAASCPGCGVSILFDPAEVTAWDDPALRDVMCAWCGTVTPSRMLTPHKSGDHEPTDVTRARRAA
jgi:hypothetical protein